VAASATISNADAIQSVIGAEPMEPVPGDACGIHAAVDATGMSLQLAARLLTHPDTPAKYVCVVDGGLPPGNKAGGYDTHEDNSLTQASNLFNVLGSLMGIINAPGENDPTKLDLDRTLIVLNTEFGRTPYGQGQSGRNHWPYGYPVALLGGPISGALSGVFGACGPDARATRALTPTHVRIGALIALGIWPFAHESYNVGDVAGAATELGAVSEVAQKVLGFG
jgi:uncharacterized protein (DUF1501 family)